MIRNIARTIGLRTLGTAILGAAVVAPAGAQSVVMATDNIGTILHSVGAGVAKVVSEHSKTRVGVRTFAGQDVYVAELERGSVDLAPLSAYGAWLQYHGHNKAKKKYQKMRLLRSSLGGLIQGLLARDDANIRDVRGVKNKRMASGFGATPLLQNSTNAVLATVGYTMADVKPVPVSNIIDAIRSLGSGRIDVTWTALGVPAVREVQARTKVSWLSIDSSPKSQEVLRQKLFPGVRVVPMKKNPRLGLDNDANMIAYDIYVLARTDLPGDRVREIVSALWNHEEELHKVHQVLHRFTNKAAVTDLPVIPYHPAAIAFYKEKGAWKADNDKSTVR